MKLRILSAAMFMVALVYQTYAQCTSGCSFSYSLSNGSSGPVSYTFPSSGSGHVLCIRVTGGGSATVSAGTINFNNHPNAVLCIGPGITISSGASFTNLHNQTTINNYGTVQNSLNLSQNQNVVNNYGTISGNVTQSNGTINNMSGGTFSSSNYTFSNSTFVNNSGASFNLPTGFAPQSGANFSGAGTFAVNGLFNPKNGSNVTIGGPATITGNVSTEAPVTFGSTLNVTGNLNPKNGGAITVAGAATVGGTLTTEGSALFSSTLSVTGAVNVKNGGPLTVSGAATFGSTLTTEGTTNISGALSVTGAVNVKNGGPLTVSGNTTIGGALTTEGTTNLSGTLSVTGNVSVKNGGPLTVAGNTTIGGTLVTEGNTTISGSLGVTGSVTVKNGGPLSVSGNLTTNGSMSVEGNTTVGGSVTINNSGNTNPALNVPNGGNLTATGGGTVTGNYLGGGTTSFNGSLTFSGTINNPNGGTITSGSSSCKTLCASSITNNGTISSTAGPNMNVCVAPSGGTQTNVTVNVNPTAAPSGLAASVSGATVTGTFTAASPAPGGYIVLRKTSAFNNGDMPVANTTYTVGQTIGGATVAAFLAGSATSFTHTNGCGNFYYAVVSSSNNSGSCGTFYTTSYTSTGPVAVSCNGPRYWVSSSSSNWNNTANWSFSSGGAGGASVPTSVNLAVFDNARNGNCSIDATVDVLGIQVSGYTGTITQNANAMTMGASGYSQSSGTFTGGSASVTINNSGLFALSGGTFTSTSNTLSITGSRASSQTLLAHSAGTFNHNNGMVEINPSLSGCSALTFTLDVISGTNFYNLNINGIAGCGINPSITSATGDVITVTNNLIHTDGSIAGQFSAKGSLTVASTADAGYGTITVDGTGAQTYTGSTGRTCLLVVNKPAGAFTPSGATDLYVQGFTLSAGSFTAPSGTLNVGGQWGTSTTIFNHSAGSFTHNSGSVEFNPTLISCANPTLTIDILPATAFYNFTVNGIAGCGVNATLTTGTGDVIACANNLTHTDGIIAGAFSFQNNLSIGTGADGGTGTITANGTGAQTYYQATGSPRTCQLIVNKSSGALTPAGGTTDFSAQGFSLVAGSFTAPTGTLNVGGPWGTSVTIFNHSGGTFTHNSGTVEFNPTLISCANPTLTVDVLPTTAFYNFRVNGIVGCGINPTLTTASGDVIACANNLTHTDGIIAGAFSFEGNLSIGTGADGGTGTITANGTGAQTYYQSSVSPRTCQLIVNKSSGALTPAAGCTDLFTQGFQLLAGSFTAPTGTLNVGGPWGSSVTIFGHSGGTFTHNSGTVEFNPNLVSCANPTFTVDVIPATLLNNFAVNGIAGCGINPTISTASGDVVQGVGDFNHADGIIAGNFAFRGNLWIYAGADGGTGTITANGTGAQTYYQAAGSPRTCQLIVNKSSGAVTPASGVTDLFTQGFSLVAGSFTAPTGTLNVGGPWGSSVTIFNHSGGTFTHNSGTVEFNPNLVSCANPTFTVDVLPSTMLYNFVVNGIAGCGINPTVSTASGDVVQGAGDFTHTDGIIAGNFAFYGNLSINAGADGGTGTITANGTGAQTYYQATGSPRTCQLIVNKSSGAVTPASGSTNLFTQGFSLVAGSFTAPTGTLNVGGPWGSSVTIFNHSGGTFTHNNGTVEFNPNLINCAIPTFTVDVLPSTLLYNFVVNGIAGCGSNATVSTASGDVVQGAGDFTHTDGIIAGNFAFYGNLSINAGADGGTGTITANGTGAQTYYQASGTPRTCRLIVTKASGALTPTGGTTDLLVQGFTLNSGSFTAPTGTLNVGGGWGSSVTIFGHSGGTFTHNNGTVEFNPNLINCAIPTFTFDVLTSTQLYNFKVNGIAGCGSNATMTTASGDTLDVANDLTYNDGICNGTIEAGGNVTVASTYDGGTGRLIFKGTNAQNFDLTGATDLFNGPVVMNKTSNSVTLLSACQLDAASQSITWNGGVMNTTSTNLLILGNNVTSGSGSSTSFANGPVRKIGNQAFTFPTGKGTKFGQIYMTAPSVNTDQFTAEYFGTNPNGSWNTSTKEATVTSVSTCEYWLLDRTAGSSNVSVRLSWDNSRSCAVSNINEQRVGQWNGSQWINQGSNGSPTGNTTAGTVQSCGTIGTFGASNPFTNITSTVTTISYAGSPFCTSLSSPQAVTFSGISGGPFSATPSGLSIDASTGEITPSTSSAGTYTIRYSVTSSVSCVNPLATTSVTITTLPVASISYTTAPWCSTNGSAQSVTRTGTAGGTYSASPAGLTIVSGTGAITPSTSTPGTYTVTYTIAASGGCAAVTPTVSVTVTPANSATISYTGSPFCTTAGTQSVNRTGTAGGTYTATSGLTIDGTTGDITPSSSTAGAKTITYSMAATGGCAASTATTSVTITAMPSASISYTTAPWCSTNGSVQNVTRTGTSGGTYSATPSGLSIVSGTGAITPSSSTPGTYTVTYAIAAASGCAAFSTTTSVTITPANSATISYTGSPFCTTVGTQSVNRTGTAGGTYTATSGLTIDGTTGDITPSSSTAGAKTITYSMAATGGCAAATATTSVTITVMPSATISYAGTPFCRSVGTAQAVSRTGTAGGTYSATPSGLSINATTGDITPSGSVAGTYTVTYAFAAAGGCAAFSTTTSVTITTAPSATISYSGTSLCLGTLTDQSVTRTGTAGGTYSATPSGLSLNTSTGAITPSTSTANTYTVTYTIAANAGCPVYTATAAASVYANPTVAAITGAQTACVGGTTTFADATAGGVWTSSNSSIATVSGGTVSGIGAGTTNINYTVTGSGGCQTTVSRSVTVYSAAPGTPGTFGNGYWIGYVYNAADYSTNYSGYYTTPSPYSYSTLADFGVNASPSTAATYQGCQVNQNGYSIRFQRTNFTPGTYQIDVNGNDDGMDIFLDGVSIYTLSGYNNSTRTVWTGSLTATSQVEIRYSNSGGGSGYVGFTFTSVTNTPPTAGTISGNQVACTSQTPNFQLGNVSVAVQGTCTLKNPAYQWESSTDNITFTAISGANATSYTIPSPLSQTTYFRRAYRTWCETVYSNTVTVTVYPGAQGTPNTYGNGLWNAYVYNQSDYATGYSGYFTTSAALSQNTTNDFATNASPATAATYQGCWVPQPLFSVRYQRTNIPTGTYRFDVGANDDLFEILLNGTSIYSSGLDGSTRTNVWTGTITTTDQVEVRFNNTGSGPAYMSFTMTAITNSPIPLGGTISGDQTTCTTQTPLFTLANVTTGTAGTCTNRSPLYQWESSTDNVTFAAISGANATSYTIPGMLSQTTYFRRGYRTWCETVYTNTVTVTVYNGAQGTPNTYGNGRWNAYVYNSMDFSTNYSGWYTTASALNYHTTTDFGTTTRPSLAPTYQGCQVGNTQYSIRYQRTNFAWGQYQIDIPYNDDDMQIILDGNIVYNHTYFDSNPRTNVWTGTLGPNSQLEIRFLNNNGPGELQWNFTKLTTVTASTPGTISGNQAVCTGSTPVLTLANAAVATQGTCTQNQNATASANLPYQWQSSTDNVTFSNIASANATSYTIPGPLASTTYFRRVYRTYCDTTYSNTVTVTVYSGAVGTPGTFGNGTWNAYVYDNNDYTGYAGYYTTASALNYNSTTDFGVNTAASLAPTYQGCQISTPSQSIRYQRTGFTPGVYRIEVPLNDDGMQIYRDGNLVYNEPNYNTGLRTNVWTGYLTSSTQLEIRFNNSGGNSFEIRWNFYTVPSPTPSTPGTIAGNQSVCTGGTPAQMLTSVSTGTQGTCTQNLNPTASANLPYQWQSSTDNVTFTSISGANATTYTIPSALTQTTYYRRSYRTYCDTVYSNVVTVTVYSGAVGTPNTYGNGLWNAYVYNATDYSTNYSGYYTAGSGLNYNSTTDYTANIAPSLAPNYQGCQVSANNYSVRYQRTNFPLGIYTIGVGRNDDNMNIILDGVTVYSSGTNTLSRTNVWTGTLKPTSQLEIRYNNTGGPGDINWTFTITTLSVAALPGTIAGNQTACTGQTPPNTLTSASAGTAGTCTQAIPNPYQWQLSTNNVSFANISGANAAAYTIPGALTQTTYYRRAYRTFCDTVFSNVVTVTIYAGAQGTPNTFGNGLWNAFVYNSTDYSTNYAGYYTTAGGLTYNTTTDFTNSQAPSQAATYQGCQVSATNYSVRYQRTGFPLGVYQIGFDINDDAADIILNGVTVYSSTGYNTTIRPNVWTGTLGANSQLEIRYKNTGSIGQISWNFTTVTNSPATSAGTIGSNQSVCSTTTPAPLTNTTSATAGTCTILVTNPYQWQSSNDNVTFANISGANAATYTIPGPLSATRYYRRVYRSYCDTVYSNTVTITVTTMPTASISYSGTPFCATNPATQTPTLTGTSGGSYSAGSGLGINTTTGEFVPSAATPGTYTVTYTVAAAGGCSVVTATTSVTITAPPTITYAGSPFCTSVGAGQAVTRTGVSGGTYSSTTGLTINGSNGNINPSTSTAGIYTVTYSYPASGGCAAGTATTSVTITALPTASISYSGSPFCSTLSGAQSVSRTGTSGGSYSSSAGLSLDASSGAITPSTSTPGTYTVTYTIAAAGGCAVVTTTTSATITTMPTASISYSGSPWCLSAGGTKAVTLTGTSGGAYSAGSGLSINGVSGLINVPGSSAGSYTVNYHIAASGGCAAVNATTGIAISSDVTSPSTPSGALSVCQASTPVVFSTSVAHYTSLSWAVSGSGNSITGSGTSVNVNWDPAFSGTAVVSVTASGCGGPIGPVSTAVQVMPTGTWLGNTNSWNNAGNWCGGVPTSVTNVVIPSGAVNMPEINANSFCNNLTLQTGTSLLINTGNNFTIYGTVTNSGTFTPGTSTTVDYASNSAQTVIPVQYVNLATSGSGAKTFSGVTSISGSFSPGAGTHNVAGSTLVFNGAAPQNIPGFTFNNLQTSGNNTKTLAGNVTIDGQLNLTNGRLAIASNALTLNGTIAGAGNLAGNCNSSVRIGGSGSTGFLRFDAGQNTLGHLSMLKSASGKIDLGSDVNICTELDLSNGKVVLGAYNLTLLSGAGSINQNPDSYVQTPDQMSPTGAGFYIREITSGSGEFVAPVGTSTYTPAYINNIGATRNFKVRAFNGIFEHGISGLTVTNIDASVNRTWEIEPLAGAGTPNVSIRLQWNVADEGSDFLSVRQNNRAYIGKNEGYASSLWEPQITAAANLLTAPYSITTSGITTFSKFAVGNDEEPLPVVMGDLKVEQKAKTNTLSWKSYAETDAAGYEIMKSTDGMRFEKIGYVVAKGDAASYQYGDPVTSGTVYYKVIFIGNKPGDVKETNTVVVKNSINIAYQFYPNPTEKKLTISNESLPDGNEMTIAITDLKGAAVVHIQTTVWGGKAEIDMGILPAGMYLVEGFFKGESTGKHKISKL